MLGITFGLLMTGVLWKLWKTRGLAVASLALGRASKPRWRDAGPDPAASRSGQNVGF